MMFQGAMADAIALWSRAFPDMQVERLDGDDRPTRVRALIAGQPLILFDSPPVHDFGFTPSISLLISCEEAADVDRLAAILDEGGQVFMPLDEYPFSPRYTWVADRFGVSWQIMLAAEGGP
nr:VOC family protein [Paracoccus marinaquae]